MMTLHRLYVKWRCFIGKGLDIWSKNPYPSNVLSNLHDNSFEFDGVKCSSMEGFLQSLKYKDAVKQKEVCSMAGKDAKNMTNADWQTNQTVWWQGKEIDRHGDEFQKLVHRAYKTMATQNMTFRTALISTDAKTLYHSKGCDNPYKTILTRGEFCQILMQLRSIVETIPLSDKLYNEALERLFKTDGRIDIEIAGVLKDGNPKQLAKYGYTLMTRFNNGTIDGDILNFLMPKSEGIPYFPVAPKRGLWETFVRINKDALPDGTFLTFTSDIHIEPMSLQGLRVVGKAVYKSPSFGWLKDEKKAIVLQVDSASVLGENELADVARRFRLRQDEYIPSNVAFFCEKGEKEYSVEIAEIQNGSVNVMYRYTIDGNDGVKTFFTPELIELNFFETTEQSNK